jgi:phage gp16-like protein
VKAEIQKPAETKWRRMNQKLHCARRDLGLDETTYRALLKTLTGKTSAKEMSERELGVVLDAMRAKGGRSPQTLASDQSPGAPQIRLICALWRDLEN